MNAARRIVASLFPSMIHERAATEQDRCRATIRLDGFTYRCGRAHVDGIRARTRSMFAEPYPQQPEAGR